MGHLPILYAWNLYMMTSYAVILLNTCASICSLWPCQHVNLRMSLKRLRLFSGVSWTHGFAGLAVLPPPPQTLLIKHSCWTPMKR